MKAKNPVYWCGLLVLLGTVLTAAGAGPVTQAPTLAADKVAGLSPTGMPVQARICIDLMCPDGTPRDEFCRCRPRACVDLLCPDGSPRDEFCQCPIAVSSDSAPAPAVGSLAVDKLNSLWPAAETAGAEAGARFWAGAWKNLAGPEGRELLALALYAALAAYMFWDACRARAED